MFAKTFRNTLFTSTLLVGASLMVGGIAKADTTSGGEVGGTVAAESAVVFTTNGTAGTINAAAGQTNFLLGTLKIQNNDPDGWTLAVKSASGGLLADSVSGEDLAYTAVTVATVPGQTTNTSVTPTTTDTQIVVAGYHDDVAADVGVTVNITCDITGEEVPAGTYKDTLTFTISNN